MHYREKMHSQEPISIRSLSIEDPLLPHFDIVKLWCVSVYQYFVISHTCNYFILNTIWSWMWFIFEPPHDKTNEMTVRPAKTQISLGMRPVWSESSLSAWKKLGSLATHWAHSEGSDQTGRMPRLIWVFAGRTVTFLVLSWGGSFAFSVPNIIWASSAKMCLRRILTR